MEVNCEGRFMNPEDYRDFKAYWKDHKTEFKRLKSKNIIWRTIHRKNWLFADTADGAKANAVYYSFIESAKLNKLNI